MDLSKLWDNVIEYSIATEEELQLITSINGYNETTLNDVIYARTGYHTIEQYIRCENLDYIEC